MLSQYKRKIINEINAIPEKKIPKLYKIIHLLFEELKPNNKKPNIHKSLYGIWEGSKIDDDLILSARKSLFPYENKKIIL